MKKSHRGQAACSSRLVDWVPLVLGAGRGRRGWDWGLPAGGGLWLRPKGGGEVNQVVTGKGCLSSHGRGENSLSTGREDTGASAASWQRPLGPRWE